MQLESALAYCVYST